MSKLPTSTTNPAGSSPDDAPDAAFVRAYTRLAPVAHVPELRIHQADEPIGLWELTEGEFRSEQPPPFWAFAWAGGQALARYLLDHPGTVTGRRVLDLACGSGLVAVAAARCGATRVDAVDIDRFAVAATGLNARANGVTVHAARADVLDDDPGDPEVVLAGDVFYSAAMADRVLRFLLRAAATGARVLVGDPGRAYLPRPRFRELARYDVPVPPALESVRVKPTTVWELTPPVKRPPLTTAASGRSGAESAVKRPPLTTARAGRGGAGGTAPGR